MPKERLIYEIGEEINNWTVISEPFRDSRRKWCQKFRCVCGFEVERRTWLIKRYMYCRHCMQNMRDETKYDDLPLNSKYGMWTVVGPKEKVNGRGHWHWPAQCECGLVLLKSTAALLNPTVIGCNDCARKIARVPRLDAKEVLVNDIFYSYRRGAEQRGYSFDLTREQVESMIFSDCFYCTRKPSNLQKDSKCPDRELPLYNGIDRVHNHLGYFTDNVVTCCKWCNYAKGAKTAEEWIGWLSDFAANIDNVRNRLGVS